MQVGLSILLTTWDGITVRHEQQWHQRHRPEDGLRLREGKEEEEEDQVRPSFSFRRTIPHLALPVPPPSWEMPGL